MTLDVSASRGNIRSAAVSECRRLIMLIKEIIPIYLKHLHTLGRSPRTIKGARYDLMTLIRFLDAEQVYDLDDFTSDVMAAYQQDLAFRLTAKGRLLSIRCVAICC